MKIQRNWDWNLTETGSVYEIQTFSLSLSEVSFAVCCSDLEEFLLFLMSSHIKGCLLRHYPACSNKSKNMPKLLAALFVFKIKGHKQKLSMLQAHQSEWNISLIWTHHLHYSIKTSHLQPLFFNFICFNLNFL